MSSLAGTRSAEPEHLIGNSDPRSAPERMEPTGRAGRSASVTISKQMEGMYGKPQLDPDFEGVQFTGVPKQNMVHWMVRLSWGRLCTLLSAVLLFICLVFALLIFVDNGGMSFSDSFHLSVHTFSTIGYGHIGPVTWFANWVITVESYVGLVFLAVVPGITFLKFSLPEAKVKFSRRVLVQGGPGLGQETSGNPTAAAATPAHRRTGLGSTLALRVANLRMTKHQLYDVRFDAVLYHARPVAHHAVEHRDRHTNGTDDPVRQRLDTFNRSGSTVQRIFGGDDGEHDDGDDYHDHQHSMALEMVDLRLDVEQHSVFGVPLTLHHTVDVHSPFCALLPALQDWRGDELPPDLDFCICVFMRGVDPVLQSTVFAMHTYRPEDIRLGQKFCTVHKAHNSILQFPGRNASADLVALQNLDERENAPPISTELFERQQEFLKEQRQHQVHSYSEETEQLAVDTVSGAVQESKRGSLSQKASRRSLLFIGHNKGRGKNKLTSAQSSQSLKAGGVSSGNEQQPLRNADKITANSVISDPYFWLITTSWTRLAVITCTIYFGVVLFFTVPIWAEAKYSDNPYPVGDLEDASQGHWWDAFFWSMQTLSTIGFGSLSPKTTPSNWVANAEAFLGVFLIAAINGIVWGKFVVAGQAQVVFSKCCVMTKVARHDGSGKSDWDLVFRLANNQQKQTLMHVKLHVSAMVPEKHSLTGEDIIASKPLNLERPYLPMLVVNGEIRHHIDESSPLYGLDAKAFKEKHVRIRVVIEAVDTLFRRDLFDMHVYGDTDVRWKHRLDHHFMHMDRQKGLVMHMEYFHEVEPQHVAGNDPEDEVEVEGGAVQLGAHEAVRVV